MSPVLQLVLLVVGITLLLRGAKDLVEGASRLALRVGVSPLMVGLTVVAFGTSSPEMLTGVLGAVRVAGGDEGAASVVVGNMIGSNLCNIGLIVGAAAMLSPMNVAPSLRRRDLPLMAAMTAILVGLAWTIGLSRVAGILLAVAFVAATGWVLVSEWRSHRGVPPAPATEAGVAAMLARKSVGWSVFQVVAGLTGLSVGAWMLVEGAVGLARGLGVSESVIGLTIVALGTSLPELATSLAAARTGHSEIALGNVVGSNVFNIGAGLGLPAIIAPLPISPSLLHRDLTVMAVFTAVLILLTLRPRIGRTQGAVLLLGFFAYMAICVATATRA